MLSLLTDISPKKAYAELKYIWKKEIITDHVGDGRYPVELVEPKAGPNITAIKEWTEKNKK